MTYEHNFFAKQPTFTDDGRQIVWNFTDMQSVMKITEKRRKKQIQNLTKPTQFTVHIK